VDVLAMMVLAVAGSAMAAESAAGVRCVLVVLPGERPWPDAQERLTLVLKDVQ